MKDRIVTNTSELLELLQEYKSIGLLALDTETTGVTIRDNIIGISLAKDEENAFYVPLRIYQNNELVSPWDATALETIENAFKDLFTSDCKYILHNAIFDVRVIKAWIGIDIIDNVHCDTMLLAHTVHNEDGPMGLKPLSAELIDSGANNPKDEVLESVKANGGSTTKSNLEMYKCDWQILGRYAAYDTIYCFALYNKLYPEIKTQGLEELWNEEVLPLMKVSYELNYNGVRVDVDYFNKLKVEVTDNINSLEDGIFSVIEKDIADYEFNVLKNKLTITSKSEIGKLLAENFQQPMEDINLEATAVRQYIINWYKKKKNLSRLFNLDSTNDKAYLVYTVLKLPCEKLTKSGKPATDAKTLEELCERFKQTNDAVKLLLQRATEKKILSTYIEPILNNEIDGYIYTGFNQTATVSGRYSSSRPINLQTLPRDDKRIKLGFIPKDDWVFVAADYAQLEPRCFSSVSEEPSLQKVFSSGEDFYSQIAVQIWDMKDVSTKESDDNYLKKIYPEKRDQSKAVALAVPYGAGAGRIAQLLNIPYDEAKTIVDTYLAKYPNLHKWMRRSEIQAYKNGFVSTIFGRRRRLPLVHKIHKRFNMKSFDKKSIISLVNRYKEIEGYTDGVTLYLAIRNNLNNAKNVQIQGLAASICNRAIIKFQEAVKAAGLNAKIILQIHDEIVVTCPKEEAEQTAKLLQDAMENNSATKRIVVPMTAEPVITDKSLAEAK